MTVLHPFVRKLGRSLRRLGVRREGIVVAVSGGPDSVALLSALSALPRHDNLIVAHFNHQLRGAESDADEEFVRQLNARLTSQGSVATPFFCERINTAAAAKAEKGNLEAVARRLRYDWLARVAAETGARWITTGHTADDQAETVLHRLLRGSGLKGLRGIAARRRLRDDIDLVRPLLNLRRAAILDYLDATGQSYRTDSSNTDPRFTRNRIRHELLPLLAGQFNPKIVEILGHLAMQAADAYRREEEQARVLLAQSERPRAGSVLVFDRAPLISAPRAVIRALFRLVWQREAWPMGRIDFAAWDRLAGVARGEVDGVDLPGGIRVRGGERVVQLEPRV